MKSENFLIKLEEHSYMTNGNEQASYFIQGKLTHDCKQVMISCGLEADHNATVWMNRNQIEAVNQAS
jgi:hypothetical protein